MPRPTKETAYEHGGYIVLSLLCPNQRWLAPSSVAQKTCVNSVGPVSMLVDKGNEVRSARHPGRLSDLVSHVRTTFHPVTSNLV